MRLVIGVAVGSASMLVPISIGEAAAPQIRNALVSFNQLAVTSGILAACPVDHGLASRKDWRLMLGLATIPAAAFFVGMLFRNEGPHRLISQAREDEAQAVLHRVRTSTEGEAEISEVQQLSQRNASSWELLDPAVRGALAVGVLLTMLQQVTGINTIICYAPTPLRGAGLGPWRHCLPRCQRAVNVGMIVFAIGPLLICTGSFAIVLGPLFCLLIGEIYPGSIRVRPRAWPTSPTGGQLRRHGLTPHPAWSDPSVGHVLALRFPHPRRPRAPPTTRSRDQELQPLGNRAGPAQRSDPEDDD